MYNYLIFSLFILFAVLFAQMSGPWDARAARLGEVGLRVWRATVALRYALVLLALARTFT